MDLSTWWEGLTPWSQTFFGVGITVAVVIGFFEIRYRIKRNRLGQAAPPKKSNFGHIFWGIVVMWALYVLRSRVPLIDLVLSLPGRIWPSFDEYPGAVYFGLLAGIFAATTAASLYAALFIRPVPTMVMQPGFAAASVTVVKRTTRVIEEE